MGAIDNVTDFITTTSWSDLPPAIQTKSVSCLLDSFGATLVGARTKVAEIADTYAREHLKGDGATSLGSGAKVSATVRGLPDVDAVSDFVRALPAPVGQRRSAEKPS